MNLSGIPGIIHGFGTQREPLPAPFQAHWEKSKAVWKQNHGIACANIEAPGQFCGEVDALYSRKTGIPVAVVTADCVPVLMSRKDGKAVAAIHAGWRGTRAHILEALWERLRKEGEKPPEWVATVGPAIGPCCYEVSAELASDFSREFSGISALAVPTHRKLDLPAINQAELRAIGLREVELIRACTRCSKGASGDFEYHSYRREGGGTRQWSVISIRPQTPARQTE